MAQKKLPKSLASLRGMLNSQQKQNQIDGMCDNFFTTLSDSESFEAIHQMQKIWETMSNKLMPEKNRLKVEEAKYRLALISNLPTN